MGDLLNGAQIAQAIDESRDCRATGFFDKHVPCEMSIGGPGGIVWDCLVNKGQHCPDPRTLREKEAKQ